MSRHAVLLIAHGSKDPAWKRPFEVIADTLAQRFDGPVVLSFLESARPSVAEGWASLLQPGVDRITVVPLFLAAGSHVRTDIPQLIAQAQGQHPQVTWEILPALGALPHLQQAIASAVVTQLQQEKTRP
jgi:sirohydrochlorin cobaltochelatase